MISRTYTQRKERSGYIYDGLESVLAYVIAHAMCAGESSRAEGL